MFRTHHFHLRRLAVGLVAAGVLVLSSGVAILASAGSATAAAPPCTEGSGWVEIQVTTTTFTYTAPEGMVISEACAKGPNAHPLFFAGPFDPPIGSYSFDAADYDWLNSNGQVQAISHIGVILVEAPVVVPPVVVPPIVEPPIVEPPVVEPPVVEPPTETTTVLPPAAGPSSAEPRATNPSAAAPSVTTPTVVSAGLLDAAGTGNHGMVLAAAGAILLLLGGSLGLGTTRTRA